MAKDDPHEPKVRFFSPMPAGYVFVAKGDVFVTKNCRKKTHDAGKTLYVVIDKAKKVLGLRCPAQIHEAVEAENKATAGRRADAVQKRDTIVEGQFEQDILRLYPKTPEEEIPKIIKHSLAKRSGRVGRTTTIDTDKKVLLAVRAHIRHCFTDYHKLLKETGDRTASRKEIFGKVRDIETFWGIEPNTGTREQIERRKRNRPGRTRTKGSKDSQASSSSAQRTTKAAPVKKAIPRGRPVTRSSRGTAQEPALDKARDIWVEIDGVLELVDEDDSVSTDFETSSGESDYESDSGDYSDS